MVWWCVGKLWRWYLTFSSYPHSLIFFVWMNDGKGQGYCLIRFLFSGFTTILGMESFLERVDVVVLPGRGVRGIFEIILANCESFVWSIGGLRFRHVCLWLVGVFIWRCYMKETFLARDLADRCALTGNQEKETSVQSRCVKGDKESFFLAPRSPSLEACVGCASCQKPPGRLLFLYLFFMLLFFYFILFNPHRLSHP